MSRITAPVGEVITPITRGRKGRGRLRSASNRPSASEALAAFVEQRHQRADARRLERLYDDLIGGFAGKGREPAGRHDLHALLGLDLEARESALPDHRVEPRGRVLQRKIDMAGGVRAAIIADLAAHAHQAETVLDRALQRVGEFRDAKLGRVAAGRQGLLIGDGGSAWRHYASYAGFFGARRERPRAKIAKPIRKRRGLLAARRLFAVAGEGSIFGHERTHGGRRAAESVAQA